MKGSFQLPYKFIRMKQFFLSALSLTLFLGAYAQNEPTAREAARNFMRSGDWDNAILVLNRGILAEPKALDLQKDLVMAYYYKRDYAKALEKIQPMLDQDDVDVMTYQLAGNVYKALEEVKDAEKMYKKALKRFPKSGALYSEYGELLWAKNDAAAIQIWERGIKSDPNYAGNYYNAAVFYFYTKDKIWSLIYGEIFVNMEHLTERATEMKKMLLKAYKEKLFMDLSSKSDKKEKNENAFAKAVMETFLRQSSVLNNGETLNMLRTRFVLDWVMKGGKKFPHRLFDHHQLLIREGLFEAYNQWLFNAVENLPAFDQWTKTNATAWDKFQYFMKGRVFKMPEGQYYQSEKD
jgi:tetratricopeptide (TPR) repeat protein